MTVIFLLMYKNNMSWTAISSDLSLVFLLVLYFEFLLKFPLISQLEKSQFYLAPCFTSLSLQCRRHVFKLSILPQISNRLQLGIRCWSSLNTKWLGHSYLWHRFCQDVFGPEQQQRVGEVPADAEDVGVGWVVLVLDECLHLERDWVVHRLVHFFLKKVEE